MKTLPTALATHYAGGTTTLADLLKITRKDGQVFAFTSASTDVTIASQLYTSAQGLDISSLEVTAGLAVDNLELTTLDDGTIFSRVEVLAGVWRNADFIISRYNWANPADGIEVRMVGTVGEVHLKRGSITAELRGLQQYLQQPIGSVTSKTCRARLGDSLCRVNLAALTTTGTVVSVENKQVFSSPTTEGVVGDTFYTNVELLLHGDGTAGSMVFTDNSQSPKTVTPVGGAQLSTAQLKFGSASFFFNGSSNYLSIASLPAFDFGTGDFAVEAWVYPTSLTGFAMFVARQEPSTGMAFELRRNAAVLELVLRGSGGVGIITLAGGTLSTGAWHHVCATRASGVARLFLNGVQTANATSTHNLNCVRPLTLGVLNDGIVAFYFAGYMDDVRITKGAARYTTSFTPPEIAFPNVFGSEAVSEFEQGWFNEGVLTWQTGANANLSQKVKSYLSDGTFTLSLPMLQTIAPGDTYTVTAGCQKRLEDCVTKFGNAINFQGEPHLPGVDQITAPA